MSTGFVLNIPQEMINRLELADQKIEKLAKTSEDAQSRIVSAFKSIGTHGLDAFISKLNEVQSKLTQLGSTQINIGANAGAFSGLTSQAQNVIDEVNRIVAAMGKVKKAAGDTGMAKNPFAGMTESLKDWNNLQSKIDEADQKIKKLTSTTMDYERQMERIRSGQQVPVAISYNEYAYAKEKIAALQEEKKIYQEKQAEITKQNNALADQVKLQNSLKQFIDKQNSLPEQRKRREYEAMRQMYIEDEKASEAAEKKKVKEAEKTEKERQKLRERRIREEEKAAERERKAYERAYKQLPSTITTKQAGQLVARSMDATSINQRQVAIKNLQTAINNLDSADKRYNQTVRKLNSEIQRQKDELKRLGVESDKVRTSHRSLMDISGQLARKLALVFSVSQITGYVKKLIEVRGEFELQQRSLQAILQNKDKANEIWQKTVDLAVKSPFRVKELVSYTKQLAAYRIESDKLFETNKMLADVSAGLGVDMQRLILAFGQVRSAAYLRGTELRQFTEAGIPILEQLAKYFTELEGRAVSVGDVFERVSKRMVSFADVEEIFRRMTSEGGSFYRMQEIQAETLKGMWSNLKDSVDIMVNEIGKGNESTLKNSLALVKQLVDNWRKVKPIIETVGISLMTYFGVDVLRKIGRALGSMLTTLSAHPVLAVASAFALLATYIWRATKAQTELNAAMSEVENENLKSLEENIALYHKLRDAINDVTKSSEDREKAYKQLESTFDSILPQEYLAKEYVEDLSKGYKDAEKAMTDYYDAKTQAQKKDRIEGLYAKELDTDVSELITSVKNRIETRRDIPEAIKPILQSGVSGIVNEIIEEVKNGDLANDIDTIADEIQKRLEKYAAIELPRTQAGEGIFRVHDVKDIIKTLGEYKGALEDIQGLPFETYGQKVASEWLNKEKESLREISDIYKKLLSLYSKYSKATDEDKVDIADDISLAMSQVPENLNAYLPLLQESVDKMKGIAEKGAFEFSASMQTLESDFVEGLAKIVKHSRIDKQIAGIGEGIDFTMLFNIADNLQEGIKKASDKLDMTPFQNAVVGGARQIAERFGQDVNIFEKFIPNQNESLSNIRQEVKSQIKSYETQILEMQTSLTQNMYVLSTEVLDNTQEAIQSMTEQLPALKAFLAFLGEMEKDRGRKDKTIEERIKVVDQMNAKYKELNKTLSETDALEGAFEAYKDAFATAYGREDVRQMSAEDFVKNVLNFPDENAVIAWLDNLAKTVKDKEDKFKVQMAKGKFEMDVQVRLKKEDDQQLLDDIQELFDRYDLSLDLKKLNIPQDLAKSLFNVDYLDLDGLRKAVVSQKSEFIGRDMLKEYDELMKKIGDLQRKRQEEEAKEFINFLKKNLNEIQVIQDKGAYNIALADRLFGEGKITAEQYMSSIRQIVEDTNKEVAKVNLEKFKDSATYIKAMGNLAAYSRDELEGMISALQGQVGANAGNMGADEIRAYYEALERLVSQYDKLESPFQKGEINDLLEYLNLQKELTKEKEKEVALEQRKSELNNRLESLQAKLASQQASGDTVGAKFTQELIKGAVNDLKEVDGELVSITSNISVISEKIANLGDGMIKSLVVAQKVVNEIANIANASTKMFDDIKSAADALGVDTEGGGWAKAGYAMEMVGGVSSELTSGLANLASGNFAGALANVVGMITKLISGFAKIHDQDYQDIIEEQAEEVERLGKAYEKLEQATGKAYSIEQLQKANAELERNVELQIASYRAMIAAEKAKKNTDEEQLKVYNEELEALTQQWEELKQSLIEGVGGVSDYRSQTREFVDSWVSAFQETGDGLSGLKENFREFFDNIIAEQAAMRVTEKFLEPFYESLNEALKDYELTAKESKDLREMVEKIAPDLSEALEKIWNQLGGSKGEGGGGLSALQKGIQGITESTAQVLEAIANSSRGYLANIDSKFDVLLASIGSSSEENPMLEQMRLVAKNTMAINTLLNSLVTGGHPQGGVGLKVFMD